MISSPEAFHQLQTFSQYESLIKDQLSGGRVTTTECLSRLVDQIRGYEFFADELQEMSPVNKTVLVSLAASTINLASTVLLTHSGGVDGIIEKALAGKHERNVNKYPPAYVQFLTGSQYTALDAMRACKQIWNDKQDDAYLNGRILIHLPKSLGKMEGKIKTWLGGVGRLGMSDSPQILPKLMIEEIRELQEAIVEGNPLAVISETADLLHFGFSIHIESRIPVATSLPNFIECIK